MIQCILQAMYNQHQDQRILNIKDNITRMNLSYDTYTWKICNGLMSGWKVTNLFGTLINRSMIHIVCDDLSTIPSFSA